MTEKPAIYQHQSEAINTARAERDRLVLECQQLLRKVATGPNCLKLLQGVRNQLEIFAKYKSDRRGKS